MSEPPEVRRQRMTSSAAKRLLVQMSKKGFLKNGDVAYEELKGHYLTFIPLARRRNYTLPVFPSSLTIKNAIAGVKEIAKGNEALKPITKRTMQCLAIALEMRDVETEGILVLNGWRNVLHVVDPGLRTPEIAFDEALWLNRDIYIHTFHFIGLAGIQCLEKKVDLIAELARIKPPGEIMRLYFAWQVPDDDCAAWIVAKGRGWKSEDYDLWERRCENAAKKVRDLVRRLLALGRENVWIYLRGVPNLLEVEYFGVYVNHLNKGWSMLSPGGELLCSTSNVRKQLVYIPFTKETMHGRDMEVINRWFKYTKKSMVMYGEKGHQSNALF